VLDAAGYRVLSAVSGAEALRLLARGEEFDLALLDYLMPGMNGEEVARHLREQRPGIPLIAVSAVEELPTTFLSLIDSYVQKGQDPEVLLSTIAHVLANATNSTVEQPTQKVILCVEDEEPQLRMRQLLFETAGHRVLLAQSADEALEIFRKGQVDAVVMDFWLSGKNGTVIAEEMKRLSPQTPIVMLSGFSLLPGEDSSIDVWLRKASFEPEDLLHEVSRLISRTAERGKEPTRE
jgi:CheY-like chemotaxis protein